MIFLVARWMLMLAISHIGFVVASAWRLHNATGISTGGAACVGCADSRDEFARIRVEQIKLEILEKLGLDSPPQVRPAAEGLPSIPQVVKYLRRQTRSDTQRGGSSSFASSSYLPLPDLSSLVDDHHHEKTEKTILFAERAPLRFSQNWPLAHFRFSDEITSMSLRSAVLNVYIRKPYNFYYDQRSTSIQVVVKEVLKDGKRGADIAEKRRHVDLGKEGYMAIHLRVDDVQRWWDEVGGSSDFLGLYVEALYKGENLAVHPQQDSKHLMYLELTSIDEVSRKKRSSTVLCSMDTADRSCCLYSLEVDFEKAGWDFVIAPRKYNAYMCSGDCPYYYPERPNQHSRITSQLSKNAISGCCHPTDYDPLTLVYMTENKDVKIKEVKGMIARQCKCA